LTAFGIESFGYPKLSLLAVISRISCSRCYIPRCWAMINARKFDPGDVKTSATEYHRGQCDALGYFGLFKTAGLRGRGRREPIPRGKAGRSAHRVLTTRGLLYLLSNRSSDRKPKVPLTLLTAHLGAMLLHATLPIWHAWWPSSASRNKLALNGKVAVAMVLALAVALTRGCFEPMTSN
jgi:hypothetical protein